MEQDRVRDLLAAYALEILEPGEFERIPAHLERCPDCRDELEGYRTVAAALSDAVPLPEPPPALRGRILAAIAPRTDPGIQNRRPAHPPAALYPPLTPAAGRPDRFAGRRLPRSWAAVGLLLIAALLFGNLALWVQVRRMQSGSPLRTVALAGAGSAAAAAGTLVISQDGEYGVLVADHLPVLDAARQYQLWLIRNGERDNGGVFSVNAEGYGTLLIHSPLPLIRYGAVGVTIEPFGGSPGPTGEKVLGGDL